MRTATIRLGTDGETWELIVARERETIIYRCRTYPQAVFLWFEMMGL